MPPVSECTSSACSATRAARRPAAGPRPRRRADRAGPPVRCWPPPTGAAGSQSPAGPASPGRLAKTSMRVPRSWRTRSASRPPTPRPPTGDRPAPAAARPARPPAPAACAPRRTARTAERCRNRRPGPAPPGIIEDLRLQAGCRSRKAGSPSASRHRPYGGELSRSAARAHATGTSWAVATAASSSASRVLPIPASPVHSTRRPRPASASSSSPRPAPVRGRGPPSPGRTAVHPPHEATIGPAVIGGLAAAARDRRPRTRPDRLQLAAHGDLAESAALCAAARAASPTPIQASPRPYPAAQTTSTGIRTAAGRVTGEHDGDGSPDRPPPRRRTGCRSYPRSHMTWNRPRSCVSDCLPAFQSGTAT